MKTLACAVSALAVAFFSASTLHPQPPQHQFRVEIHPVANKGPVCTITNLSRKPVWALVLEVSASSQPARKATRVWDAILESHPPVEPGAAVTQPVSNLGINPLPDKIQVIAALWTDGETLGSPASVNLILNRRQARASEYEDAARILQQGLDQNWKREQYDQAFRDKPDTGAVYTVRTALTATLQTAKTPQQFTQTMQFLLNNFQQLSKQLRKVKPI